MGVEVALIDKGEITQKMISHSLHYYSAKIHQFENLESLLPQLSQIKPDVVFIDWDMKKGDEPLALEVQRKINDLPLIVLHRDSSDPQLKKIKNRIKKPIDAHALRELVARIVPKMNQFKIDQFLEFPQKKEEEPEEDVTLISKQIFPDNKLSNEDKASEDKTKSAPDNKDEKLLVLPETDGEDVKDLIQKNDIIDEKEFATASDGAKEGLELPKLNTNEEPVIEKQPAFVTSQENSNTLLNDEAQNQAQKIVQDLFVQKGESLLKDTLKEYQETQEFKNSINKTIESYVNSEKMQEALQELLKKELSDLKTKLPGIAKELIQKKIDTLMSEEEE